VWMWIKLKTDECKIRRIMQIKQQHKVLT
jgi:hypothetical protein